VRMVFVLAARILASGCAANSGNGAGAVLSHVAGAAVPRQTRIAESGTRQLVGRRIASARYQIFRRSLRRLVSSGWVFFADSLRSALRSDAGVRTLRKWLYRLQHRGLPASGGARAWVMDRAW